MWYLDYTPLHYQFFMCLVAHFTQGGLKLMKRGELSMSLVLREGPEFALLEAKLAAEAEAKTNACEQADLVRLELCKKRQEREAARASVRLRKCEESRLEEIKQRHEKEISEMENKDLNLRATSSPALAPSNIYQCGKSDAMNTSSMPRGRNGTQRAPIPSVCILDDDYVVGQGIDSNAGGYAGDVNNMAAFKPSQERKWCTKSRMSSRKSQPHQQRAAATADKEPTYRSSNNERKVNSDPEVYLQQALWKHPRLFEVRGERKEMFQHEITDAISPQTRSISTNLRQNSPKLISIPSKSWRIASSTECFDLDLDLSPSNDPQKSPALHSSVATIKEDNTSEPKTSASPSSSGTASRHATVNKRCRRRSSTTSSSSVIALSKSATSSTPAPLLVVEKVDHALVNLKSNISRAILMS